MTTTEVAEPTEVQPTTEDTSATPTEQTALLVIDPFDHLNTYMDPTHVGLDEAFDHLVQLSMDHYEKPRNTLRDIAFEAQLIDAILTETGGELSPEMELRLDDVNNRLMTKADGVRDYLSALDADAKFIKEEETRLADVRKRIENRAANFKQYVLTLMQRMNRPKLQGQYGTKLAVTKNSSSALEIIDASLIDDKFKKREWVESIDNKALKDECKTAGGELHKVVAVTVNGEAKPRVEVTEDGAMSVYTTSLSLDSDDAPSEALLYYFTPDMKAEASVDGDTGTLAITYRSLVAKVVTGYHLRVS